jgi:hypothetical protein
MRKVAFILHELALLFYKVRFSFREVIAKKGEAYKILRASFVNNMPTKTAQRLLSLLESVSFSLSLFLQRFQNHFLETLW